MEGTGKGAWFPAPIAAAITAILLEFYKRIYS